MKTRNSRLMSKRYIYCEIELYIYNSLYYLTFLGKHGPLFSLSIKFYKIQKLQHSFIHIFLNFFLRSPYKNSVHILLWQHLIYQGNISINSPLKCNVSSHKSFYLTCLVNLEKISQDTLAFFHKVTN